MKQDYYKLPLDFKRFFEEGGGYLAKCTELESIDQHIGLLLNTCPGEHRFDPNYGCRIWDLDFERISSLEQWKGLFIQYVKQAVTDYEKRISGVEVSADVREVVREEILDNRMVRKRVDITVRAMLDSTGIPCAFGYKLYLGPLSNE